MAEGSISVESGEELDAWVVWYQRQGFGLRWYQPPIAVLARSRRLSAGWLIFWILVGWLLLWIPLFLYLILFAIAKDEVITIRAADHRGPVTTTHLETTSQAINGTGRREGVWGNRAASVSPVGDQPIERSQVNG